MLWKKQRNTETRRIVHHSPRAKVFSYYQSRSLPDSAAPTVRFADQAPSRRTPLSHHLKYAPVITAGLTLIVCLVYLSTLDTTPRIQAAGSAPNQAHTVLGDLSDYQQPIQQTLERSVFNRSKLFINTNRLAQDIEEAFPELGEVSIILPLVGRRPIVEVSPTKPVLTLATPDGVFVVDGQGKALASVNDVEVSMRANLLNVQDQSGLPLEQGGTVLPQETIQFIAALAAQLAHQKVAIQSIILPPVPSELHLRVEGKPYFVKFNLRGEGRRQAGTFLAVKQRLEGSGLTPSQYIDVRVPEKAFYR